MPGTYKLDRLQELAASLQQDILLAKSREEHVRLTARANEAAAIHRELITEQAVSAAIQI